ncbi:beta-1,6-N-acetylglucosaminyltransferase [Phocaeicola sp. HCN-40430]|uniref:beta-1,6-N-acetylglucosaminyltransferase n=1 Tax=Phocaeicola sp. HCN-40430 TaxID=3134664 RepID=UPI0030BA714B
MNHAFIFQVHNYPKLLHRIVSLLIAPNHYCFIHVDKKVDINQFKEYIKNDHIIFLNDSERIIVNHGGFSQIQCTINLLKKVKDFPIKFDYVHSLSGQDFPLVNPLSFDNFFETHKGNSYMIFDTQEEHLLWSKPRGKYEERYRKFHFPDKKINPILLKLINGIQRIFYLRRP